SDRQPIKDFFNPAAYLLGVYKPLDEHLQLTGGVRYDYHNIYGNEVSGRVGAVSSPIKNLHLKALYGNAFKAPSPLLLYGLPLRAGDIIGNTSLKPQFVHTFEGQASYKLLNHFTIESGVAYSVVQDQAEFVQRGGNLAAQNSSTLRSLSWESSLRVQY